MTERIQLQWSRLLAYLIERANEASTWAGLMIFISACGYAVDERWSVIIGHAGLAVAGMLRVLLPNHLTKRSDDQ
jgi:hypothetical protein